MKEIYLKVLGMTCNHCKHKITVSLSKLDGVEKVEVTLEKNMVFVSFDEEKVNIEKMIEIITELGYKTDLSMTYSSLSEFNHAKINKIKSILFIFISIIFVYMLAKRMFGFDFLNTIPTIDQSISYPILFIIGLMTSIHCVGMCGAINLAASMGIKVKHPYRRPLLYNLGRVISYTITGGIAGLIGNVLAPSLMMQGILVGLASIFMLIMGLSMLGLVSKKLISLLPKSSKLSKIKTSSPFVVGLLNGLMPCGPLQAMQVYAISTASFFLGAFSMLLFALGTVPLMLLVGLLFNFVKGKKVYTMQRISAVLVVLLAFVMFNRAAGYLGFNIFSEKTDIEIAEIKEGYQYVEIDVQKGSYEKIVVQKDIPVEFNLKAKEGMLNGCNNPVMIPSLDIKKKMTVGDNIITFTPTEVGTINYSCWMSMIRNQIVVVDDISQPIK